MAKGGQLPSSSSAWKEKNKPNAHCPNNKNNNNSSSSNNGSPLQDLNNTISSKDCLRFFSKNPKSAQNLTSFSGSTTTFSNPPKENVSNNSSKLCRSLKTGSKRMSSVCSTKVLTQKKKINKFTPPARNVGSCNPLVTNKLEMGINRVGKLETGSMSESKLGKPSSNGSKENLKQKQVTEDKLGKDIIEKSIPVNKLDKTTIIIATSSNTSMKTTMPPIQASVSPEINCASSSSLRAAAISGTKTPVCYGAGHIVSGVIDRRKCRARGILTVGQKGSGCINLNKFENGDELEFEVARKSRMSLVSFPAEASMQWLLSPCEEVDEHKKCDFLDSYSSGNTSSGRLSKLTLLSLSKSPVVEGISWASSGEVGGSPLSDLSGKKGQKNRYVSMIESSPFSGGSLGSGNVIQTPQSELSSDRHVGTTCLNTSENMIYDLEYDMNCATEDLLRSSMSPKINRSIWGSHGFSFHLLDFVSLSNSIDLFRSPKTCASGCFYASNSKSDEMSVSGTRVCWRDGLASRIFEMDESDICRCLSDDESDIEKNSTVKLKSCFCSEIRDNVDDNENCEKEVASLEFIDNAPKYYEEREKDFVMKRSNLCEESMCTDGGELAASGDSDWTSCYKNQLFEL